MRRVLAVAVALTLFGAGCSSADGDASARGDAVDCRELGGGWVFVRYEQNGSSVQGVHLGPPTTDGASPTEPDLTHDEFDEATRLRVAEGWDDEAVAGLAGPDASPGLRARLDDMPSCLDQLT